MDEFDLTMIAVGHGDALLGQWRPDGGPQFNFLIDGGPRHERGKSRVLETLGAAGIDKLDLLVLSHVDADHLDGLAAVAEGVKVATYWGPCLAAFRRHSWVFDTRIQRGLHLAAELEESLRGRGTTILCPMEGWSDQSPDGAVQLSVLNPPRRLYERLLLADDAVDLFRTYPTPLGWLLTPEDPIGDEPPQQAILRTFLATRPAFDPRDLPAHAPSAPFSAEERAEALALFTGQTAAEPEFFGDQCLNDTSIVVLVQVTLEGRQRRRLLFPGDLENWLYVASRHPTGLLVDVLKAPHHGSRVHIGPDQAAYDAVMQMMRPTLTMVSAKGTHRLPQLSFRSAAGRWSRALFCPCTRGREIIVGELPQDGSCHERFQCSKVQVNRTVRFKGPAIEGLSPACLSAATPDHVPIVQIRQHIVDPSPVMDRLVAGELLRHLRWVKDQLVAIRAERRQLAATADADTELAPTPVTAAHLAALARNDGRLLLANRDLPIVLGEGRNKGDFWAQVDRYGGEHVAYALPTADDLRAIRQHIATFNAIALHIGKHAVPSDIGSLLHSARVLGLDINVGNQFGFPVEMFTDIIWPALVPTLTNWTAFLTESELLLLTRVATLEEFKALLGATSLDKNSWESGKVSGNQLRAAGIMGYKPMTSMAGYYESQIKNFFELEQKDGKTCLRIGTYNRLRAVPRLGKK